MEQKQRVFFRRGIIVGLSIVTEQDIDFVVHHLNDYQTTQYLGRVFPLSYAEEKEWLEKLHKKEDQDQVFGITLTENSEIIGMMGLHRIDWIDRTATTGAWIAPEHCGKGYGNEAKILLLEYAFLQLGLRKIRSIVLSDNTRSQKYSEKCGYKVEATLRAEHFHSGRYVDEIRMAVFREDFEPVLEEYKNRQK